MLDRNGGFLNVLYMIMEWITRIAYINILWIFFSILGLIVFGVSPATVALFTVTRKWVMGQTDIKVFSTFWNTYRREFFQSNIRLWPLAIFGYVIYIDYQYLTLISGTLYFIMLFVFINVSIVYFVVLLFILPTYVHFQYSFVENYKSAFLIGISKPFSTITMGISVILVLLLIERIPGLIPFFPVSLTGLLLMWISYYSFKKLENKAAN